MSFERYHEAVDYLQRRLWHELPIVPVERALQARVREVLAHFGDPHRALRVVHVGGSAGKGSTAAMTASILQAAGLRTGLYTSPHLQTFIERTSVDSTLIAPDAFAESVLGVEPLVRRMHAAVIDGAGYGRPSLVEVAFAAGMAHLAAERCDAAVIEVGLGGRTDYSNVFDEKPVTVLTTIEHEHRERLGWTIASIAREKAELIRGRETVVTGTTRPEALRVIESRCSERAATLWRLGRDIRVSVSCADAIGSVFSMSTPHGSYARLRIALVGAHQVRNAALAVAAAEAFGEAEGRALTEEHVRAGLTSARISGRMEAVQQRPLVLLDSAHNPCEARALADALRCHYAGKRITMVCGILADKDQGAMVRAFAPVVSRAIVTQPPLAERAGDPERMLHTFRRALGPERVVFEADHWAALDRALVGAGYDDMICVTGSMFLVGALRERWVPERQVLERRTAALDAPTETR